MPGLSINDAGTWRNIRFVHVNDAGTWRSIRNVYVNDAGTWRLVFSSLAASAAGTAPLSKTLNATSITSNNIVATAVGGSGTYTYSWALVSHNDPNSTPTINNSTSATCTVTTNQSPASQLSISVTVECTVTDSVSGQSVVTNTVTIDHTHDNGV